MILLVLRLLKQAQILFISLSLLAYAGTDENFSSRLEYIKTEIRYQGYDDNSYSRINTLYKESLDKVTNPTLKKKKSSPL